MPRRLPCFGYGEPRPVTSNSLTQPLYLRCRAARREAGEAARVAALEERCRRPCLSSAEATGRPRSEFCSRACQLADRITLALVVLSAGCL
jgi:hypothetical protein